MIGPTRGVCVPASVAWRTVARRESAWARQKPQVFFAAFPVRSFATTLGRPKVPPSHQQEPANGQRGSSHRIRGRPTLRPHHRPKGQPPEAHCSPVRGRAPPDNPADDGAVGCGDRSVDAKHSADCDNRGGLVPPSDCQALSDISTSADMPFKPSLSLRATRACNPPDRSALSHSCGCKTCLRSSIVFVGGWCCRCSSTSRGKEDEM